MKLKQNISKLCILSMCFILCITSVLAQDVYKDQDYGVFSYYEVAAGLVPGKSIKSEKKSGNIVCVVRIYSDSSASESSSNPSDTGHTFLTFLNTTTSNITVGRHTVAPNKMVSIGKFGKFDEYKGAFYNVETSRKERKNWYTGAKSIYMELTASQLQTISTYLKNNQSGYSLIGNNCSTYAVRAWNSLLSTNDDQYIDHYASPTTVYQEIENIGYCLEGNLLLNADYELCYYNGSTQVLCTDYIK